MIERRGAILRHCLHATKEQLKKENITVTFLQLLATCIFAGNALTNVGGGTPYNARFGNQPSMLPDLMTLTDGESRLKTRDRIKSIALEKIVTATAIARVNRALIPQPQPPVKTLGTSQVNS